MGDGGGNEATSPTTNTSTSTFFFSQLSAFFPTKYEVHLHPSNIEVSTLPIPPVRNHASHLSRPSSSLVFSSSNVPTPSRPPRNESSFAPRSRPKQRQNPSILEAEDCVPGHTAPPFPRGLHDGTKERWESRTQRSGESRMRAFHHKHALRMMRLRLRGLGFFFFRDGGSLPRGRSPITSLSPTGLLSCQGSYTGTSGATMGQPCWPGSSLFLLSGYEAIPTPPPSSLVVVYEASSVPPG